MRMHEFGSPAVLGLEEVARPEPLPTELLVRVHAAGINPVDWKTRAGRGVSHLQTLPFTPGWDVSGVVESVGYGVTLFKPGDHVYGMPWFPRAASAYADYVTAPSRQFAAKPAGLTHIEAAGLPLAGLTALHALTDAAQVKPGERVLVHAAAGGVGHLAVQIAKALGAYVIGTTREVNHDFVRSLGADEVVDYTAVDVATEVGDVDVVIDLVGGSVGLASVPCLRGGGLLISVPGGVSDELRAGAARAGVRVSGMLVEPDRSGLLLLNELIASGRLRVEIAAVFALAEADRAHAVGEVGRTRGKLVLAVG